jgi:hypothetical protein
MVAAAIRTAFTRETTEAAHQEWRAVADRLRRRFDEDAIVRLVGALLLEQKGAVTRRYCQWAQDFPRMRASNFP